MESIPNEIAETSRLLKDKARSVVDAIEEGRGHVEEIGRLRAEINQAGKDLNRWVYDRAKAALARNQIPAVVGGDHSAPLGLIQALSEHFQHNFGILHIDAHADFARWLPGVQIFSASIMFTSWKLQTEGTYPGWNP